jgi:hypothetical protein
MFEGQQQKRLGVALTICELHTTRLPAIDNAPYDQKFLHGTYSAQAGRAIPMDAPPAVSVSAFF